MKVARYIFINKGLGMSPGKIAAQAAHAEMMATIDAMGEGHENDPLFLEWLNTGHTKLVMEAEDSEHIYWIERYLKEKGYLTYLVIDEGRTEIRPHSPTALAVELVDRESEAAQFAFGDFRTYKERKPKENPTDGFETSSIFWIPNKDEFQIIGLAIIIIVLCAILAHVT